MMPAEEDDVPGGLEPFAAQVAHDFNNLLTGVLGNLELLEMRAARNKIEGLESYLSGARNAGARAAGFAHRLLVYSGRTARPAEPVEVTACCSPSGSAMAKSGCGGSVIATPRPSGRAAAGGGGADRKCTGSRPGLARPGAAGRAAGWHGLYRNARRWPGHGAGGAGPGRRTAFHHPRQRRRARAGAGHRRAQRGAGRRDAGAGQRARAGLRGAAAVAAGGGVGKPGWDGRRRSLLSSSCLIFHHKSEKTFTAGRRFRSGNTAWEPRTAEDNGW